MHFDEALISKEHSFLEKVKEFDSAHEQHMVGEYSSSHRATNNNRQASETETLDEKTLAPIPPSIDVHLSHKGVDTKRLAKNDVFSSVAILFIYEHLMRNPNSELSQNFSKYRKSEYSYSTIVIFVSIITSFIVVLAIQFIKLFPNEYESRILALISAVSSGIGVAMIALMKRYIIGEVSSDHPAENDYSNSQSFVGLQDNTMENEFSFDDEDQRLAASLGVASQHATLARLKLLTDTLQKVIFTKRTDRWRWRLHRASCVTCLAT